MGNPLPNATNRSGDVVVLADAVTALGYSIAGVDVHCPGPGEAVTAVRWARDNYRVVLITAELAAALPAHVREASLAAMSPAMMIISDARGRAPAPNVAARIRGRLGVEA